MAPTTYLQNRKKFWTWMANLCLPAWRWGDREELTMESGGGSYRMLHLELMGDDVLLYSTGNSVWSLGLEIVENEKKKKMYVYGCTAEIEGI